MWSLNSVAVTHRGEKADETPPVIIIGIQYLMDITQES